MDSHQDDEEMGEIKRRRTLIITILSDFGSFYPAQMKGVILSRLQGRPGTNFDRITFVDIAHDIPAQDVRAGAFVLLSTAKFFPPGTIHIAVVDPGVGTARRCLMVESGGQIFIGPDNGLLLPAARSLGRPVAYEIVPPPEASSTFHGRDIFAPAAALVAAGQPPESLGHRVRPVNLDFGEAKKTARGLEATVIYVDRFGNLILNLHSLPDHDMMLKGIRLKRVRTYAEGRRIEPLITLGSHGFAEIAINQGNAAEAFCLRAQDRIELEEI